MPLSLSPCVSVCLLVSLFLSLILSPCCHFIVHLLSICLLLFPWSSFPSLFLSLSSLFSILFLHLSSHVSHVVFFPPIFPILTFHCFLFPFRAFSFFLLAFPFLFTRVSLYSLSFLTRMFSAFFFLFVLPFVIPFCLSFVRHLFFNLSSSFGSLYLSSQCFPFSSLLRLPNAPSVFSFIVMLFLFLQCLCPCLCCFSSSFLNVHLVVQCFLHFLHVFPFLLFSFFPCCFSGAALWTAVERELDGVHCASVSQSSHQRHGTARRYGFVPSPLVVPPLRSWQRSPAVSPTRVFSTV